MANARKANDFFAGAKRIFGIARNRQWYSRYCAKKGRDTFGGEALELAIYLGATTVQVPPGLDGSNSRGWMRLLPFMSHTAREPSPVL